MVIKEENSCLNILNLRERAQYTKVNGTISNQTEKENIITQMGATIKVLLLTDCLTDSGDSSAQKPIFTKDK